MRETTKEEMTETVYERDEWYGIGIIIIIIIIIILCIILIIMILLLSLHYY